MSYTSFQLRDIISATSFAVVGNVCKLSTLVINYVICDKHASSRGLGAWCVTLVGAAFYEQAPYRVQDESLRSHMFHYFNGLRYFGTLESRG